jgi:elongation factor 1 alpha-like protein
LFVAAAQFMFDRTRQPQMSAFFNEENDIAEEDESNIESCKQNRSVRDSDKYQRPDLSEMDEVRLRSCLEEIRNVIGDSIPEHILIETVLKNEFNFNKALDAVLSSVTSVSEKTAAGEFCAVFYIHHVVEKGSRTYKPLEMPIYH